MAEARRVERLEQVILQTVAPLISYGLSDPRLAENMVTVTRVRLSKDLSIARVNWSCIGGPAHRSKAEHALEDARGQVQAAIADAMRTRTTPRVHFHYDEAAEKAARVNDILSRLARERAEKEGPGPEDEDDAGEPSA